MEPDYQQIVRDRQNPDDPDALRREVERLQRELRAVQQQRDDAVSAHGELVQRTTVRHTKSLEAEHELRTVASKLTDALKRTRGERDVAIKALATLTAACRKIGSSWKPWAHFDEWEKAIKEADELLVVTEDQKPT